MILYKCDICSNKVVDKTRLYHVAALFKTKDFAHVCIDCYMKLEEIMKPIKEASQKALIEEHRKAVLVLRCRVHEQIKAEKDKRREYEQRKSKEDS